MMTSIYRSFETKAELDTAYDVEGSVPDFNVYARQYVEASASTRQNLNCHLRVPFGPAADEYCDIFPAQDPNAPVMVFIHGGYWKMLTSGDHSFAAEGLAKSGVTVVVANYSHCPKVTIAEITRQMRSLIAWTYRHVREYNGDPERMYVMGHSAGAHLTAMCALTHWKGDYGLSDRIVKGIIPISGLFDLEPLALTFLQSDLNITEDQIETHSPLRLVRSVPVPMLLSFGMDELNEFLRQSTEFLKVWQDQGNAVRFFPQEGRNHFNAITDLMDPKSELVTALLGFMQHTPTLKRTFSSAGSSARPTWDFAKTGRAK